MIYDITTLRARPGTTPAALNSLGCWLTAQSVGRLVACWYSELGPVNRILVLRSYDDAGALYAHRHETMAQGNPFGVAEFVSGLECDAFLQCPGAPTPSVELRGPWFEVRDYRMQPDGIRALMDLWRPVLPARLALGPMVTALHAVSGRMPRLLHMYPWPSLEERTRVRKAAREVGWPPAGAHHHVVEQETTLYLGAAFSPLQ